MDFNERKEMTNSALPDKRLFTKYEIGEGETITLKPRHTIEVLVYEGKIFTCDHRQLLSEIPSRPQCRQGEVNLRSHAEQVLAIHYQYPFPETKYFDFTAFQYEFGIIDPGPSGLKPAPGQSTLKFFQTIDPEKGVQLTHEQQNWIEDCIALVTGLIELEGEKPHLSHKMKKVAHALKLEKISEQFTLTPEELTMLPDGGEYAEVIQVYFQKLKQTLALQESKKYLAILELSPVFQDFYKTSIDKSELSPASRLKVIDLCLLFEKALAIAYEREGFAPFPARHEQVLVDDGFLPRLKVKELFEASDLSEIIYNIEGIGRGDLTGTRFVDIVTGKAKILKESERKFVTLQYLRASFLKSLEKSITQLKKAAIQNLESEETKALEIIEHAGKAYGMKKAKALDCYPDLQISEIPSAILAMTGAYKQQKSKRFFYEIAKHYYCSETKQPTLKLMWAIHEQAMNIISRYKKLLGNLEDHWRNLQRACLESHKIRIQNLANLRKSIEYEMNTRYFIEVSGVKYAPFINRLYQIENIPKTLQGYWRIELLPHLIKNATSQNLGSGGVTFQGEIVSSRDLAYRNGKWATWDYSQGWSLFATGPPRLQFKLITDSALQNQLDAKLRELETLQKKEISEGEKEKARDLKTLYPQFKQDLQKVVEHLNVGNKYAGVVPLPEIWLRMQEQYKYETFVQLLFYGEDLRDIDLQIADQPQAVKHKWWNMRREDKLIYFVAFRELLPAAKPPVPKAAAWKGEFPKASPQPKLPELIIPEKDQITQIKVYALTPQSFDMQKTLTGEVVPKLNIKQVVKDAALPEYYFKEGQAWTMKEGEAQKKELELGTPRKLKRWIQAEIEDTARAIIEEQFPGANESDKKLLEDLIMDMENEIPLKIAPQLNVKEDASFLWVFNAGFGYPLDQIYLKFLEDLEDSNYFFRQPYTFLLDPNRAHVVALCLNRALTEQEVAALPEMGEIPAISFKDFMNLLDTRIEDLKKAHSHDTIKILEENLENWTLIAISTPYSTYTYKIQMRRIYFLIEIILEGKARSWGTLTDAIATFKVATNLWKYSPLFRFSMNPIKVAKEGPKKMKPNAPSKK